MTPEYAISSKDLSALLDEKQPLLVFDLRLKESYESGHISGSVHAICDANSKKTIMPNIPKTVKIVLIDDDGSMSSEIASMMRSFGLDAYFLENGIKDWTEDLVSGDIHSMIKPDELWHKLSTTLNTSMD